MPEAALLQTTNRPLEPLESHREAAAFIEPSDPWFLIHTQPCRERAAIAKLQSFNVKTFLPITKLKRANKQNCPLFPSYLFASFNFCFHRDIHESLSRLPLLGRVVYFGTQPAQMPEEVIQAIREQENADGIVELAADETAAANFKQGDQVMVSGGLLKGFYGVFDCELSGADRVRILLNTVEFPSLHGPHRGGAMRVEVDKRDLVALP